MADCEQWYSHIRLPDSPDHILGQFDSQLEDLCDSQVEKERGKNTTNPPTLSSDK